MSYRLYAPGARKGNAHYVARVWVWGEEHEFICLDKAGRPTKEERSARRYAQAYLAEARRKGRPDPLEAARGPETFADAAARYIAGKAIHGPDEKRIRALAEDPIFGALALGAIVQDDIYAAAQLVRRGKARRSITANASKNRDVITPAAAVLHYAARNHWCGWLRVEHLPEPQPETRRPAAGVGEALLVNTTGLEHLLILLWFRQGWRIGESLTLRAEKIRLAERECDLWIPKIQKWKTIELHEDVFFALANIGLPGEGTVFPWTRWQVYRWLERLCDRLGVRFTPHMARHEFGSQVRDAKGLVEIGTWTSPASTGRYVHGDKAFRRTLLARVRGK